MTRYAMTFLAAFLGIATAWALPDKTPIQVVTEQRAAFGERISPAEAPKLLHAIAANLGGGPWGLLVKSSGNNCGGFACDIICNATDLWDVFIDGPDAVTNYSGTAEPAWQPKGSLAGRTCQLVTPAPPEPPQCPEPPPCPTCPPPTVCPVCPPDLSVDVAILQSKVAQLQGERDQLQEKLDNVKCETANSFWRALGVGCRVIK